MWENIFNIVLAVTVVVLTRYVIPAIKAYIETKNAEQLIDTIAELVMAAEQLFPKSKTGEQKLEYVQTMLEKTGVELTDTIRAKIESAVYSLTGSDK